MINLVGFTCPLVEKLLSVAIRISCIDISCKQMCGLRNISELHSHLRDCTIISVYPMNKNTQYPKLQMSTWTHLSAASMMYIARTA